MSALLRLATTETKLFFREPISWGFSLGLPPVLLIVLGSIPMFRLPDDDLGGLRFIDIYVPIVVSMGIAMLALATLPQHFATYRDKGVFRRMRVTPVKPLMVVGAQLLVSLLLAVLMTAAILCIARVAFSVQLPGNVFAYVLAFAMTTVAMVAVGLLVASVAPTGTSAGAIGSILLFPMLFAAGLWIPRASMNEVLLVISDTTPLGAGVQALQDATAGTWPQLLHLAVMLGWTIVAGGLAARFFRWE